MAIQRSFIKAGAKNILFSLWKVSDEPTSELMINFYENYTQKSDYVIALRQAKIQLLTNEMTSNPRYWSAFLLIGE